jgi:hypothetical protein
MKEYWLLSASLEEDIKNLYYSEEIITEINFSQSK